VKETVGHHEDAVREEGDPRGDAETAQGRVGARGKGGHAADVGTADLLRGGIASPTGAGSYAAGVSLTDPPRILYLDAELVAMDKPAGLLVHPTSLDAHESRTALEQLQQHLGEKLYPLHRLDKATSGVLLFARHADGARRWGRAFDGGEVRKRYVALVRGWPDPQGVIDYALARDPEMPSAGQVRIAAVTKFNRLATFEWPFSVDARHGTSRYALLEVEPVTGRRHQIRRHLKHIAHPVIGDTTHGKTPHNRAVAQWLGTRRLWLHAASVRLPGGLRIDAPCGAEWGAIAQGTAP